MSEVVMVIGLPASGKGTLSQGYIDQGYIHLNRDKEGGSVIDLLPKMKAAMKAGENVVLDNLLWTAERREPFIDAATQAGIPIRCEWMATSKEDCQINALHRMWDRYGQVFLTAADFSDKAKKDPNIFPIAVLFKYGKEFENPTTGEGFAKVAKVKFKRSAPHWDIKGDGSAIIFDYDDTLRYSQGDKPWPEDPSEVDLMEGRKKLIKKLAKDNLLLGASNQSAIAKGLSDEVAQACFDRTHELLGVKFEYMYCPHKVPPVNCYCRKPQSGMGVYFVRKYGLDPAKCTYVGDQTTDKTFAKRMGFKFVHEKDFF